MRMNNNQQQAKPKNTENKKTVGQSFIGMFGCFGCGPQMHRQRNVKLAIIPIEYT